MISSLEKPLVTVVIPCYNHSQYVRFSIKSVLEQDYEKIELIIIDDGSKDDSEAVINEYLKSLQDISPINITFISRENRGLCNTLNQAFEMAAGEYVLTLASDDILLKKSISMLVKSAVSDPAIAITSGYYVEIDSNNKYIPIIFHKWLSKSNYATYITFEDRYTKAEQFHGQASLYKRNAILQVGGFRPDFWVEDYYMQLKVLDAGFHIYRIKDIVLLYRIHGKNSILAIQSLQDELMKIKQSFAYRQNFEMLNDKADELHRIERAQKIEFAKKWNGKKMKFRNMIKLLIMRKYYESSN